MDHSELVSDSDRVDNIERRIREFEEMLKNKKHNKEKSGA